MAAYDESMRANMAAAMGRRGAASTPAGPANRQFDGRKSLAGASMIDVDRLVPDPDQPRRTFDEASIGELADSLVAHGQIQPLRVRWDDAIGRYVVIVGERRLRAAIRAGIPALECVVASGDQAGRDRYLMQVLENLQREGIPPIELARSYRRLMGEFGLTHQQLADRLKVNRASVTQTLRLLDLPEDVRKIVDEGQVPASTAYEIARVDDPAEQATLARDVAASGMSLAAVRERVKAARPKGRGARAARLPLERKHRAANGLTVTVKGRKGFGDDSYVAALEDALAKARGQSSAA